MPVRQETRILPPPETQRSTQSPQPLSVPSNPARDEHSNEMELQYLGLELNDSRVPSDNLALKTVIAASLVVLFYLDVRYATNLNITSLYIVVIFLTIMLQRARWILGVTVASILLNLCALRWDTMYPPPNWSIHFALVHLLTAIVGQVPAGALAYRSLVMQRKLELIRERNLTRQRELYERERAARAAEQEARHREKQATEDLRIHAAELTRILEREREARRRENEARKEAREALGERDYLRGLTEEFQRTLLPKVPAEIGRGKLALGSLYQPAIQEMQMGGDFYDAMLLPNGMVGLVIGDVAGHGVEAAALTAFVTTTLRAFAVEDALSPGRVLARVNRSLTLDQHFDAFVSVFYGVYDPETEGLLYANAGHEPPILLHADDSYEGLQSTGLVVGVDTSVIYDEREVKFNENDCLIMLTDGMTEARSAVERRLLGWNGVAELALKERERLSLNSRDEDARHNVCAPDLVLGLYRAALNYAGGDETDAARAGSGLTDDVAMLVVVAGSPCATQTERELLALAVDFQGDL